MTMPMSTFRFIVMAAVLASAAGCAGSLVRPNEGWRLVRTRHVLAYTTAYGPQVTQTLDVIEHTQAALRASFFPRVTRAKLPVVILTRDQFVSVAGFRRRALAVESLPGVPEGENGLLVVDAEAPWHARELISLLYLAEEHPNTPLWFRLGFARFASSVRYLENQREKASIACFDSGSGQLVIPLADVIGATPREIDQVHREFAVASAAAVVNLGVFDHGAALPSAPPLNRLMDAFAGGADSPTAILRAFEVPSLDAINQRSRERVNGPMMPWRRLFCPLAFGIPPALAVTGIAPETKPLPRESVARLLSALRNLGLDDDGYLTWVSRQDVEQRLASPRRR